MYRFMREGEKMVQGAEDWSTGSRSRSIIYTTKSIKKTTFSPIEGLTCTIGFRMSVYRYTNDGGKNF